MIPYSTLIAIDKTVKTPVFLQISSAITESIRKGVIPVGAQLPGSRALADSLGLHRKTVIAAYDELLAQGWLETQSSRGTFVCRNLPDMTPTSLGETRLAAYRPLEKTGFALQANPTLDWPVIKGTNAPGFNDGFPDVRLAPLDALGRAFKTVLKQGYRKNLLFYADTHGEFSLRAALTDYLRETRGLPVSIDNVLITRGSTMAIYLAANLVLQAGDTMVVGEISYGSANLIFKNTGAKLLTVPVDAGGMDVEALAEICKKTPVRMVYVTPHHHYPTTVMMPAERRLRLLQLAQTYGFCILEDDYDYDFHYDCNPVLPLAGADAGGHVVYVGSLCKAISPALRIGYIVAPVEFTNRAAQLRRIIDRQGDQLTEAAVALLFREGEVRRHLKKAQKAYESRRNLFCQLLQSELGDVISFSKPTGGMAVWAKFDRSVPLPVLAQKVRAQGWFIPDGSGYAPQLNATRLGFASVTEAEIEQGIGIIKKNIEQMNIE
jgi:GntR family transcriptional regulator/MocR family aminotransferase